MFTLLMAVIFLHGPGYYDSRVVGDLGIASHAVVLTDTCPPAVDSTTVSVFGRVINARTRNPLGGVSVVLEHVSGDAAPAVRGMEVRTDASGEFRFCNVRASGTFGLIAEYLGGARETLTVELPPGASVFHEFAFRLDFPSRLVGQVLDDETGQPVRGVSLRMDGVRGRQVTDGHGRFIFNRIRPGEYAIEVEHVAYHRMRDTILVDGTGQTLDVTVRLGTRAIPLNPLVVSVAARPTRGALAPVYDRIDRVRLFGGGSVFDRHDIERRNAARFTHVLDVARGVRVETVRRSSPSL